MAAMNILTFLFLPVLVLNNVSAYNILVVFPYPGKSHAILGHGYVRHLLKAGHEVTYITPRPMKPHPKLKQVDVSSTIVAFDFGFAEKILNFNTFLKEGSPVLSIASVYELMQSITNTSITHENVQKFLIESNEKFDVAITEWLYSEFYCGFPAVFNIPYIWSSSIEPHPAILGLIDEPGNPAYFADHMSPIALPLTFSQRVKELWGLIELYFCRRRFKESDEKAYRNAFGPAAAKRGVSLPTLEEMKYQGSMVLGNSHVSSGDAHKLPQNYIPINGYHIEDKVEPLSEKLQKIMDNSPNGVIYFSMGSMMESKTMPEEFKKALLDVFGELKQTVLWKYEGEMVDLPKNVHILQWAPQQSILAHPNCILFITHGGLLSTTETLHFGVPIIGIPLFADQHFNVIRAVNKGFALQVPLGFDTPAKLRVAIKEILSNPKYRERVKELSLVYHHRPTPPGAELVHWVEHVIQTKGAPHLQSPALHVPLYQKLYLDLLGLIVVSIIILVSIIKKILKKLKRSKKITSNKKKN